MSNLTLKPLVGVVSDLKEIEPHLYHVAGDKYLRALSEAAEVVPVIIPSLLSSHEIDQWLLRLDGLFLPGAYSMVDPSLYREARIDKLYDYDPARDELAQKAILAAIELDMPLFGVCRGLQDINVAMQGSLYQAVQDVPGLIDHREDKSAILDIQYGNAHEVEVMKGGLIHDILKEDVILVNSLHTQGIKKLGNGLAVEAEATDGLVEAIRIKAMSFGLAVQWHPEWRVQENCQQRKLFEAFGQACRAYHSKG